MQRKDPGTRPFNSLPEKQRAFAQFVVQGMGYADAYFKAGYLAGRPQKAERVRRQAMKNGGKLACIPEIRAYIARNRAMQYEPAEYGVDMVKMRARQIMMGEVAVPSQNMRGENVLVHPSHKDMVAAARLLFDIIKYEDSKPRPTMGEFELDDDLMERSTSFLRGITSKPSKPSKPSDADEAEAVVEVDG